MWACGYSLERIHEHIIVIQERLASIVTALQVEQEAINLLATELAVPG